MGKTAEIMTKKQALQMRMAINVLIGITDPDRYCVAIAERNYVIPDTDADYEVHLYLRDPKKSGYIDLVLLAHAIEEMGTQYMAVDSTYDAGTEKGKDIRQSVKIW